MLRNPNSSLRRSLRWENSREEIVQPSGRTIMGARSIVSTLVFFAFPMIGSISQAQAQQAIRIGATMSETGPYGTQGIPARNGYLLCVLGRKLELLIHDDKSDPQTATNIYEKLVAEDKVDLVFGPYGALALPVMAVTEKYRKVMIAPLNANAAPWQQGRRYIIMQLPPGEFFLTGLIDIAARNGLKTVALI